jgi:hypothetical protein
MSGLRFAHAWCRKPFVGHPASQNVQGSVAPGLRRSLDEDA